MAFGCPLGYPGIHMVGTPVLLLLLFLHSALLGDALGMHALLWQKNTIKQGCWGSQFDDSVPHGCLDAWLHGWLAGWMNEWADVCSAIEMGATDINMNV